VGRCCGLEGDVKLWKKKLTLGPTYNTDGAHGGEGLGRGCDEHVTTQKRALNGEP